MIKTFSLILAISIVFVIAFSKVGAEAINPVVLFETSLGNIKVELYPEKAPITVENFLAYVKEGFYEGLIFHRVIKTFVIQGGGFLPGMERRQPTRPPIKNEARVDLKNERGTIAMARTMEVDSASSQFFINVGDNRNLDHVDDTQRGFGYAVFGKVVEGMDVIDKIRNVPTHNVGMFRDVPKDPVIISKARLLEAD